MGNYVFYYCTPKSSNVGGIGIYVKNNIVCNLRDDLKLENNGVCNVEDVWLEVSRDKNKYIIGGIYQSDPNQSVSEFNNLLTKSITLIGSKNIPSIVVGDINIDLLKFEGHKDTTEYVNKLILNNFLPLSLLPTRITNSSSTIIDHIYFHEGKIVSNDYKIYSGNIITDITDHFGNYFIIESNNKNCNKSDRPQIRLFSAKNKQAFAKELASVKWEETIQTLQNPCEAYEMFHKILTEIYNKNFPVTRISRKRIKDKKWITPDLKKSSGEKNMLYSKWLKTKSLVNEQKYKQYKTVFNKISKAAETNYYNDIFSNRSTSIKQIWKHINTLCSFNSKQKHPGVSITKLIINNNTLIHPQEICEGLNNFFCNIGKDLSHKVPTTTHTYTEYMAPSITNSFFMTQIDETEIIKVINNLDRTKGSGPDIFSVACIIENAIILAKPLSHIYNRSLATGIVPKHFKTAKVIPIYKKGVHSIPGNYRPISLLPIFNKIFEKIIAKSVLKFLDKYNILNKFQYGFRENYSTTFALLETVEEIYSQVENGYYVAGIYLDFQKAFDSVNHQILLNKIQNYGIRGQLFNWFKNYLQDRKQYTIVNDSCSSALSIDYGVPQGSVLGPILFLLYINDIGNSTSITTPRLFADDTNIFIAHKDLNILQNKCMQALSELHSWIKANKLSLNIEKTNYSIFAPKSKQQLTSCFKLDIDGIVIDRTSCAKYLGVYIDETLNWKEHIKFVHNSILKYVGIFYKLRYKIPVDTLRKLYFATVYPRIIYGIEIYCNTNITFLHDLMILNNKLLRIAQRKKTDTIIPDLYISFNILPVNLLFQLQLLLIMHKFFHHVNTIPLTFGEMFVSQNSIHDHNTRRCNDLAQSLHSTSFGQRCYSYLMSKKWNSLPLTLKAEKSTSKFVKLTKQFLFSSLS